MSFRSRVKNCYVIPCWQTPSKMPLKRLTMKKRLLLILTNPMVASFTPSAAQVAAQSNIIVDGQDAIRQNQDGGMGHLGYFG